MSSELVLFEAVPTGAIETLFDRENQPWFKRAHIGKFLEIIDMKVSTRREELREEMRGKTRYTNRVDYTPLVWA